MGKLTYEKICKNWGLDHTDPEVRAAFEWVKEDPADENGQLTRELGIRKPGGALIKLMRVNAFYKTPAANTFFYEEGSRRLWIGSSGPSVSARDFSIG